MSAGRNADDDVIVDDDVPVDAEGPGGSSFHKRLLKHVVTAGGLGFLTTLVTTSILYEISTNTTLAVFFALLLILASMSVWLRHGRSTSAGAPMMVSVTRFGSALTAIAAIPALLIGVFRLSGLLGFSSLVILGIAVTFALAFAATDVFNSVRNGVMIARQVYTIAGGAIIVGAAAGVVFALADVEEHVRRLGWEQWVCAAVGFLGGALMGHANYYAVDQSMLIAFDPIELSDD